jgi:hypothetical protein
MSTEDNKAIVHRFYEEVWNKGNVAAVDELIAPNYVNHFDSPTNVSVPERFQQSREETKHFIPQWLTAFPDLHFINDDSVSRLQQVGALPTPG